MFEKRLCDKCVKNIATYQYMPGTGAYCENCVPRGCSCNHVSLEEVDGELGKNYIKIDDDWYAHIEENGKEYPCCEFEEFTTDISKIETDDILSILEKISSINIENINSEYYKFLETKI